VCLQKIGRKSARQNLCKSVCEYANGYTAKTAQVSRFLVRTRSGSEGFPAFIPYFVRSMTATAGTDLLPSKCYSSSAKPRSGGKARSKPLATASGSDLISSRRFKSRGKGPEHRSVKLNSIRRVFGQDDRSPDRAENRTNSVNSANATLRQTRSNGTCVAIYISAPKG
jgi:hypothetical protein